MPDQSEVEQALCNTIGAALYPNGTGSPSAITAPVRVARGWPIPDGLKADLKAGKVTVTVFSRNGVERNTTRYPREAQEVPGSRLPHTLTAIVAGNQVTIGGTVASPQNVLVVTRAQSFSYAVQPGDTLTTIATGLALLIAAAYPGTTNAGPVITVSGHPGILQARVATSARVITELKRQDKSFQISLWCPTPVLRDAAAKIIDPALAEITFLAFPDGSCGFVHYERSISLDTAEAEGSYRRDLFYWVEYPTVRTDAAFEIGAIGYQQQTVATPITTTNF